MTEYPAKHIIIKGIQAIYVILILYLLNGCSHWFLGYELSKIIYKYKYKWWTKIMSSIKVALFDAFAPTVHVARHIRPHSQFIYMYLLNVVWNQFFPTLLSQKHFFFFLQMWTSRERTIGLQHLAVSFIGDLSSHNVHFFSLSIITE